MLADLATGMDDLRTQMNALGHRVENVMPSQKELVAQHDELVDHQMNLAARFDSGETATVSPSQEAAGRKKKRTDAEGASDESNSHPSPANK